MKLGFPYSELLGVIRWIRIRTTTPATSWRSGSIGLPEH